MPGTRFRVHRLTKGARAAAGLALGVASERMVERAKTLEERGAYFDVISS